MGRRGDLKNIIRIMMALCLYDCPYKKKFVSQQAASRSEFVNYIGDWVSVQTRQLFVKELIKLGVVEKTTFLSDKDREFYVLNEKLLFEKVCEPDPYFRAFYFVISENATICEDNLHVQLAPPKLLFSNQADKFKDIKWLKHSNHAKTVARVVATAREVQYV